MAPLLSDTADYIDSGTGHLFGSQIDFDQYGIQKGDPVIIISGGGDMNDKMLIVQAIVDHRTIVIEGPTGRRPLSCTGVDFEIYSHANPNTAVYTPWMFGD